jgi:hypothetical protein
MPTNAYAYFVITDGTTTVTFEDGAGGTSNYHILAGSWNPAVAGLRRSQLGGVGPYNDVTESFEINIRDTSVSGCLAKAQTLNSLLNQAERFYSGENVSPVLVKFCPKGATVSSVAAPLQAMIIGTGRGDGTEAALSLGPVFDTVSSTYNLTPVRVSFVRRGAWLHTETAASSSATTNGSIASTDLTAVASNLSPVKVSFTNGYWGGATKSCYVITADDTATANDSIDILDAEGASSIGAPYTSVNDSAKSARNTNVLRYTPAGTTEATGGFIATSNLTGTSGLFSILINARNNSATTSFYVRFAAIGDGFVYTPRISIGPYSGTASTSWTYVGYISIGVLGGVYPYITASAAAGSLDIDSVVIVKSSSLTTNVLKVVPEILINSLDTGITYTVDHRSLTNLNPLVSSTKGGSTYTNGYSGGAAIYSSSRYIFSEVLQNGTADVWSQGTIANTWTMTRTGAYLVPQ